MLKVQQFRKNITLTSTYLKAEFDSGEPEYGWQIGPNNAHARWVNVFWQKLRTNNSAWQKYIDEAGYVVAQDEDEAVVFMSALEQALELEYEKVRNNNRTYNC